MTLADICAPSLVLGQAIGRWGNYANMEAYGARVTASWAQFFPLAVEIPTVMADGTTYWYWHMATFFYESLCCALIFVFLWRFKKKATRCGDVFFFYLLLYCAERTIIEGLRDDSLTITVSGGQVRFSQVLSTVVLLLVAIIFFRRLCARKRPRTADYMAWGAIALGIACTYVGEFERNAYQGLFPVAQFLLALLLLLDGAFLFHYTRNMRRIDKPVRFTGAARCWRCSCCFVALAVWAPRTRFMSPCAGGGNRPCDVGRRLVLSARHSQTPRSPHATAHPQQRGVKKRRGGN